MTSFDPVGALELDWHINVWLKRARGKAFVPSHRPVLA